MNAKIKDKIAEYAVYIGILLVVGFFFLKPIIINVYEQYKYDNETITNQELSDYQEWESKNKEREFNNKEIGN